MIRYDVSFDTGALNQSLKLETHSHLASTSAFTYWKIIEAMVKPHSHYACAFASASASASNYNIASIGGFVKRKE